MRKSSLCLLTLLAANTAFGQDGLIKKDEVVAEMEAKKAAMEGEAAKPDGWNLGVQLGSSASLTDMRHVAGAVSDGTTFQLGLVFDGKANYKHGRHEWLNSLNITHQQTRTPVIDAFIKTADNLDFRTSYLYSLASLSWMGPFARARLQSQILKSQVIYAEPTRLVFSDQPGKARDLEAEEAYTFANPFDPMQLRQSAGFFARPVENKTIKATFTLGAGAQEIVARDGYALNDDGDTDAVEFQKLESTQELGIEIDAEVEGHATEYIFWSAGLNILHPFVYNADNPNDLEGLELTNIEFKAKVGVKLSKWLSVDYTLDAKRIPFVLDEWQVQNGLLLSASFETFYPSAQ
jgi:hypothetical protein